MPMPLHFKGLSADHVLRKRITMNYELL